MTEYEKTLRSETKYKGRIFELRQDVVALPNGREAVRDVIVHSGGVGVLPLDSDGNVYLVRQFRNGPGRVLLEIPAGKINPGEDPLECGKRELMEEVGAKAETFTSLGTLDPTPAYCSEVIYIYLAENLTLDCQRLDEDEFLYVEKYPLETLCRMVCDNEITDAKTQIALLKTAALRAKSSE